MKPNWIALVYAALLLAFGIFVIHGPLFEDGFAYLHGDLGDARFVHLVLEHGYRVAAGLSHDELWSPTWTMYPLQNALSFSEVLIGNLPLYGTARWLGAGEATASQVWSVACSVLNFLAAGLLLRRLKLVPFAVWTGAFLFAFALPRAHVVMHTQLLPHFPTVLSAYAVLRYLEVDGAAGPHKTRSTRLIWLVAAGWALALQVACSVYLGWFAALGAVVAVVASLAIPSLRRRLVPRLKVDAPLIGVALVATVAAVLPIGLHYLKARGLAGGRAWTAIELPTLSSYLIPFRRAWLYGWLPYADLAGKLGEQRGWVFPGLASFVALGAFWKSRRAWGERLCAMQAEAALVAATTAVALILLSLDFGKGVTLWGMVYRLFPAADAIRATYRIGLFLLLPFSVLVATLVHVSLERARTRAVEARRPLGAYLAVACFVAFALVEQAQWNPFRYGIAASAARVGPIVDAVTRHEPRCALFAYKDAKGGHATQLDGMWASLESGVPTTNGGIGTDYEPWSHLWNMDQVNRAGILRWLASSNAALPPGDGTLCIFQRDAAGRLSDVSAI